MDGDGLDDVIIGAPENPDGDRYAGAAYILLGSRFAEDPDIDLYLEADYQLLGEYESDRRGRSVAGVGDVDGDGLDDVAVGSTYLDGSCCSTGSFYVFLGADLGIDTTISLSEADQKWFGEAYTARGDSNFRSVSGGDANGDGFSDVLIGSWGAEGSSGKAFLVLGE